MSEELRIKKIEEEEALKKSEEEEAKEKELTKDDRCPHCLSHISEFPYINHLPMIGWLECASCGVIFSPQSVRKLKIERATKAIHVPKLVVPV